jgi:large repetitive protein
VTGTVTGLESLQLEVTGTATDDKGVERVLVTVQEYRSRLYLQPDGSMGATAAPLPATLADPGAATTTWSLPLTLPSSGDWRVVAYAVDTVDQQDLSTSGATARYPIYPGDEAPVVLTNLQQPVNGTVFTDGRIFVSGRVEDDQQIRAADVAIVNSAGQYLRASSGTFSTSEQWNSAFLNSPGSPGSNFSFTSPVLAAGEYTVRVRGVDQNGLATDPTHDVTVTVEVPASEPPAPSFTVECDETRSNVCELDARATTDENPAALTYSWDYGDGSRAGSGAVVTKTFTRPGDFTVTLTARDEWGVTATATQTVTIAEPPGNTAPTAVIGEPSCSGLVCNFSSGTSKDPDAGDVITRLWSWGDGTQDSTFTSGSHTFAAAGTYTVTLTVTDGWGKATTVTREVTVAE